MEKGAKILVSTCAGVQRNENVVIVTDNQLLSIAQAVQNESANTSAVTSIIISPARTIDNQEPVQPIAAAMKEADVIFLVVDKALAHTKAVREAISVGARVISMTAFTERMMKSGGLFADFEKRKPLCDKLAELLTKASMVQISNPAGTNLHLSVRGRSGNSHSCIVRNPGFTAVPNIEANIAPIEGTTHGTLVVDGSIPYYDIGIIKEPVKFEIDRGFVQKISGGKQAQFLDQLLAAQNDKYVYNIAQFAIGLNPECKNFTGEMLNDEGVNGTIHIGIGTSASLGGEVQAKTHFDAIIRKPSVWLDNQCIIEKGKLKIA